MPNRFMPITNNNVPAALNQINRNFAELDRETQTKQFKDAQGNALLLGALGNNDFGMRFDLGTEGRMVFGPYQAGRFGMVWYDSTDTARMLYGQAPNDGRPGFWISAEGEDVITLLS